MSDLLAYPGTREWWETRRHWHTDEFARVVDAVIARAEKPEAYSTYDLHKLVGARGAVDNAGRPAT
jgi:hypothetical protein